MVPETSKTHWYYVVFQVIAPQSMVCRSKGVFYVKSVIYVQNVIFCHKIAFYHEMLVFVKMTMFMASGCHNHAKSISRWRRSLATVQEPFIRDDPQSDHRPQHSTSDFVDAVSIVDSVTSMNSEYGLRHSCTRCFRSRQ